MKGKSFRSGNMFSTSLIALVCALVFLQAVEAKVNCYVCSWQKPTTYGVNITDTCSHYNFNEAGASQVECEKGCEAVSIRKSKNGDVEHFYKNCIPETSNLEDKCTSSEDGMQYKTTCECMSDLCNGANWSAGQISGIYFLLTLVGLYKKIVA
ncbi:unnamed protein product [Orchesella dallaii]|uniref:Protein quiver n=1 Tax=Orchesella dallaii TaxID=48710 RepID=A0ABP1QZH3_9HEXA